MSKAGDDDLHIFPNPQTLQNSVVLTSLFPQKPEVLVPYRGKLRVI